MRLEEFFKLIENGESERIEFKEKVTKNIAEEIVAFANSLGGYLLIGVKDDKTLVGLNTKELQEAKRFISNCLANIAPPITVKFHEVRINRKSFLIVEVPKSKYICSIGGIAYIRVGTSKRPLSIQETLTLGAEILLFPFDKTPTKIPAKLIWEDALKRYERGLKERNIKVSDIYYHLKKLDVIISKKGRDFLTFGGALIFLENPQEYFPQSYLRVCFEEGYTRISGPLWKIIDKFVEAFFKQEILRYVLKGFRRIDYEMLPARILREGVTNALIHRNYTISSETFVSLESNAIKIKNPGAFPPGVTPEDPHPVARNPLIYELMFNMGYIEKQGAGVKMIFEEARKNPYLDVEYKISPNFTTLLLKFKVELDEVDKKILDALIGPKSSSEIARIVGLSKPAVINRLNRLIDAKLVKRIGSGAKTKYRLTS